MILHLLAKGRPPEKGVKKFSCRFAPSIFKLSLSYFFLSSKIALPSICIMKCLEHKISLEGDHSFGVQSRFASYTLYLYCTACPGYLEFGLVHELECTVYCNQLY